MSYMPILGRLGVLWLILSALWTPSKLSAQFFISSHSTLPACVSPPTIADFFDSRSAFLQLDQQSSQIGYGMAMHSISTVTVGGVIHAYYVAAGTAGPGVGHAISTDGVNFSFQGLALNTGVNGSWDDLMASFPGVWYDSGTYYMVYEGSGHHLYNWIGLATSTDGVNFVKHPTPIIQNDTSSGSWEKGGMGTPNIYKSGTTWYVYYTASNGTDYQIGVASGASLTGLSKSSLNPIIRTSSTGWDSGTVGKRDIIVSGGVYYMVYEGSTDGVPLANNIVDFSQSNWSSGLARSTDLIHWTKFPLNPILPVRKSYGNDSPNLLSIRGATYIYYRVNNGNGINYTRRALIASSGYGGFARSWVAQDSALGHSIGRRTNATDWSANVAQDNAGYLQFGPYVSSVPVGENVAVWALQVDNNSADNYPIVKLEVSDFDAGQKILGSRVITRQQWAAPNRVEYFAVPFNNGASNHRLEFRIYWYDRAYVIEQLVGYTSAGAAPLNGC